jgi:serine/threonine-protein kinase
MYNVLNAQPTPPSAVRRASDGQLVGVPAYFDGVIACALAKEPDQRYQTAEEFRQALALAAYSHASAPSMPVPEDESPLRASPPPGFGVDDDVTVPLASFHEAEAPTSLTLPPTQVRTRMESGNAWREAPDTLDLPTVPTAVLPVHATEHATERATEHATEHAVTHIATQTVVLAKPGGTGSALAPAYLDQVTATLARRLGPIAKIMVRKAAAKAEGQTDARAALIAALCGQVDDPSDRAAIERELTALR